MRASKSGPSTLTCAVVRSAPRASSAAQQISGCLRRWSNASDPSEAPCKHPSNGERLALTCHRPSGASTMSRAWTATVGRRPSRGTIRRRAATSSRESPRARAARRPANVRRDGADQKARANLSRRKEKLARWRWSRAHRACGARSKGTALISARHSGAKERAAAPTSNAARSAAKTTPAPRPAGPNQAPHTSWEPVTEKQRDELGVEASPRRSLYRIDRTGVPSRACAPPLPWSLRGISVARRADPSCSAWPSRRARHPHAWT